MPATSGALWPNKHTQGIVAVLFLSLTALLAGLCALRIQRLARDHSWRASLAQYFAFATLIADLLFVYGAGFLIFGVGTSLSARACMSASMLCIWAYAAAKLAAYLFLLERVFIVHASGLSTPRYRCKWWIVGAASSILWLGAPIGMMITHSHHLDEDGICIIGLPRVVSVYMVALDVVVNVYMTAAFLVPLLRCNLRDGSRLVVESLIASGIMLVTTGANMVVIAVLHKEPSWACLSACASDAAITGVAIYVTTSHSSEWSASKRRATRADLALMQESKDYSRASSKTNSPARRTVSLLDDNTPRFDVDTLEVVDFDGAAFASLARQERRTSVAASESAV